MIYTVNNLSEDDSDFTKIRSGVERVVCHPNFKMSFPSHWLIFSLVVRQEMIKDSIISFEQCSAIAQDCGITDHEELYHALWFLHTKIGLIRHFPTSGLHDLVIRHPQILFDMVTKLIVNTFTFENADECLSTEFEKKGIFTLEDFKQIDQASTPLLPPEKLLQLLEHLRIVAPFEEKGRKKYFLPCVLAHSEESESPSSPQSSDIPPLLITFECGYCPKGLYGTLVQCLITNDVGSKFKWELKTDQIFRNQVTFLVSSCDVIALQFHSTFLKLTHSSANQSVYRAKCTKQTICNEVRHLVERGIRKVSSEMSFTPAANHSLTFYCGNYTCNEKIGPHPATEIKSDGDGTCHLWCKRLGGIEISTPPLDYSVWLQEEKQGREKEATHLGFADPSASRSLSEAVSLSELHGTKLKGGPGDTDHTTSTVVAEPSASNVPATGRKPTDFHPADDTPDLSRDFSATKCWGLESIHSRLDGTGVGIAVIDAGVNVEHKAFEPPVKGLNFVIGAPPNAWRTQPSSHGTMVAFVAAGKGFKGVHHQTGISMNVNSGVAPNSSLVICSVGESYSMRYVRWALEELIDRKKKGKVEVDIVCMSFGERNDPRDEDQQKTKELIKQLRDLSVIMVAAAGNYGKYCDGVLFPACLSDVISVGALNHTGYKRETNHPSDIDVYAPGEAIAHPSFDSKEGVKFGTGSSCAAPAVAGLVALLVQLSRKYPNLNLKIDLHYVRTVLKREMKKRGDPTLLDPREYFQRLLLEHEMKLKDLEIQRLKAAQPN